MVLTTFFCPGLLAEAERSRGEFADYEPPGVQSGQPAGGQPGAGPGQLGPRHPVSPGEGQRELSLSGQLCFRSNLANIGTPPKKGEKKYYNFFVGN